MPASIFTPGALYNVRVAVMTVGTWSPFGDACEITAPGSQAKGTFAGSKEEAVSESLKAAVYPNPTTASFGIDLTTPSQEKVEVKVYDMIGNLLESRNFSIEEMEMQQFGDHYPSGVYRIIVTQGSLVKTLLQIKR